MASKEYDNYLKSAEWKKKATNRKQIDDYTCQLCGTRGGLLDVHHFTYYKVGREDVYTDLVTLCPRCHKAIHGMMNRITGKNPDGTDRHGWSDLKYAKHMNDKIAT